MFRSLRLQVWAVLSCFLVLVLCGLFLLVSKRFENRLDAVYQSLYWDVADAFAHEVKGRLSSGDFTGLESDFSRFESHDPRVSVFLLDERGTLRTTGHSLDATGSGRDDISFEIPPLEAFLKHRGRVNGPLYSRASLPSLNNRPISVAAISSPAFRGYLVVLLAWNFQSWIKGSSVLDTLPPRYWLLASSFLAAVLVGGAVAHLVTKRIRKMVAALTALERGDYGHRIAISGKRELDTYAAAINSMAERTENVIRSLQEMNNQRKELLATTSHDLKRPITFMISALETLEQAETALDPAKEKDLFERFKSRSREFSELIHTFSELSDLDRPQTVTKQERINLRSELRATAAAFELQAREKNIELRYPSPGVGIWVEADPALLRRAFHNLIENALHYTGIGGGVTLDLESRDGIVRIECSDTGMGIPAEEIPFLFTPLVRGNLAKAQNKRGTGLGLAIVKRVIALHGGSLDVSSTPGKGSTFSIELRAV